MSTTSRKEPCQPQTSQRLEQGNPVPPLINRCKTARFLELLLCLCPVRSSTCESQLPVHTGLAGMQLNSASIKPPCSAALFHEKYGVQTHTLLATSPQSLVLRAVGGGGEGRGSGSGTALPNTMQESWVPAVAWCTAAKKQAGIFSQVACTNLRHPSKHHLAVREQRCFVVVF